MISAGVLAVYYLTLFVLAVYGVHRMVLLIALWRTKRSIAEPAPPGEWPVVTIQLPLFNEYYVAERLIDSVCNLDYPRDRLEIQVLDDSTDSTVARVEAIVAGYRDLGFEIHHLHRRKRVGFKAGALAAGLKQARGDLIAVFDADFVPNPDFLRRTVPHFADLGLGMVQGRWEHINRDYSLLTRIQAIFLDGHFLVEHTARNRTGCFFNFNGTAGIWRRQAIEDAGGWSQDTLTEDLDLSYRSQLAGWRFLFLPDLKVPSELPVDINAFKSQQFRWAKGSIQTARKLLPRILRAPLPLKVKAEAFVHLTNNGCYLLMVLLSLLVFPAMTIRRGSPITTLLLVDTPLFLAATVSVLLFYIASQVLGGDGWGRKVKHLPLLMGLGIGLAINNSRAVIQGLYQRGGTFVRTPKYGIEERRDSWRGKKYRAAIDWTILIEGLLAVYFMFCFLTALASGMWASLPFLYLFLQGYTYIFTFAISSALPSLRRARKTSSTDLIAPSTESEPLR